ncbi:MAG TPA: hypothetical protein VF472_06115 [Burkholderiaceae bacterium]
MKKTFAFPSHLLRAALFMSMVWAVPFSSQAAPEPPTVIGSLSVLMPDGQSGSGIEIPDAKIILQDAGNATVDGGATELDGSFRLKAPKPGLYSLCWNIQGRTGCRREINLVNGPNAPVRIETRLNANLVHGRILTGDARPCWENDPFFKLDFSTRVELSDAAGQAAAQPVRANVKGYYLFPVEKVEDYKVRAICEKAEIAGTVPVSKNVMVLNLTLPTHAPRIDELVALDAGRARVRIAPGTPLKFNAKVRDPDGNAVEYLWRGSDGRPALAGNLPTIGLPAIAAPSRHTQYLIARNGKGGYSYKRIDLEVGPPQVEFSGFAIDETTRAPIANATVEFAGHSVSTNAQGWFSLSGPTNPGERYVLNIRHPNYALMSAVYDRSSTGNTYELISAEVLQFAPTAKIDVTDTRSSGPCGTKGQDSRPAERTRALTTVQYFDPDSKETKPLGADLIKRLTAPQDCRNLGAQIVVPANALVGARMKKPVGNIRMAFATLNPTRRALPGDYQGTAAGNQLADLLSYGATYAEFHDSTGARLNLRPGTTAEVRIPVPPSQRSSAAPSIDFWSYNETTGRWVLEGKARLQTTATGPVYVGKTKHFSTLNMDVAGTDPAKATCVRIELGPSLAAWSNLQMRSTVSYNGNSVKTKETFLNNDQYHAIYRIPFGTSFPPNTVRIEIFGTFNGRSVALVDNVINTDLRPKMTGTNLWPPYPYSECGIPIVLNADPIALPAYATNSASNRPYFLTGPSGAFLPPNGEASATAYYNAIDPASVKATLGGWWNANGFNPADGSGGTRAAYLNNNDLGLGRDMNCLQNGTKLACYVTNYGAPDQNPANADAAQNRDVTKRGATVAMELDNAAGNEAVQFYVYANTGPTSVRLNFADLDGFGPKPVPQLCQVCHGGNPGVDASGKATFARFREFDLPSYKYSAGRSWDYGQSTLTAAELAAFGTLNQMVQATGPATSPIHDLIHAWYPGSNFALAPAEPAAATVPSGWSGQVAGYNAVYGKTCRTCHVARDAGTTPPGYYTFDSYSDFSGTSFAVCGLSHRVMPNSIVTYKNFWADSSRVLAFEALMSPAVPSGTCQND